MNLMTTFTVRKSICEYSNFTIQEVFDILNNRVSGYSLFDKNNREELNIFFDTETEVKNYIDNLSLEKELI